jgi:hypothetical protein
MCFEKFLQNRDRAFLSSIITIGVCGMGCSYLAAAAEPEDRDAIPMRDMLPIDHVKGTLSIARKQSDGHGLIVYIELLYDGKATAQFGKLRDRILVTLFKDKRDELQPSAPPPSFLNVRPGSPIKRPFEIVTADIRTEKNILKPVDVDTKIVELQTGETYVISILTSEVFDPELKKAKPVPAGEYKVGVSVSLASGDGRGSRILVGEVCTIYEPDVRPQPVKQNADDKTEDTEKVKPSEDATQTEKQKPATPKVEGEKKP